MPPGVCHGDPLLRIILPLGSLNEGCQVLITLISIVARYVHYVAIANPSALTKL